MMTVFLGNFYPQEIILEGELQILLKKPLLWYLFQQFSAASMKQITQAVEFDEFFTK